MYQAALGISGGSFSLNSKRLLFSFSKNHEDGVNETTLQ